MLHYELLTPHGERLDNRVPLPEYPRPQLRRDSYLCLNGEWSYAIRKAEVWDGTPDGHILVPFAPESVLSGVRRTLKRGEYLFYQRSFSLTEAFLSEITLLHIDAVDQEAEVFCNDIFVGRGEGGYLPLTLDVSAAVRVGENKLTVRVKDDTDPRYPTGKQRKKRGGIWYTPICGIWQSVWMESVPRGYIRGLRLTPDIDRGCLTVEIDSEADTFTLAVLCGGAEILSHSGTGRRFELTLPPEKLRLWSPEDPFLYDLEIAAKDDRVASYFALRKFEARDRRFFLNGKPYFVNGLLDQGYFSDGIYTPAAYDAYRDDIMAAKALGYNALRKHIKIEPLRFYYLCDVCGMLVLQDMVNVGRYSFFKDTVLPFAGLRRHRPYVNVSRAQRRMFVSYAQATVKHLYNCPSVVYYTIFNEGWGQFDGDGMYLCLRAQDPTRVYDATSGWFREKRSDVASEHIYFRPLPPMAEAEALPQIISEFGGYSLPLVGHRFNDEKTFGYRAYRDTATFEEAFLRLYETEVLPLAQNGLAGAIYTQLSDVEDECNGLLTYDRQVCKLNPDRVLPLMQRIFAAAGHLQ